MKGSLMDLGVTKIGSGALAKEGVSPEMAMQDYLASVFESREAYKLSEDGLSDFFDGKFINPVALSARDGEFKGYFKLGWDKQERCFCVGMEDAGPNAVYDTERALNHGLNCIPHEEPFFYGQNPYGAYINQYTDEGKALGALLPSLFGELKKALEATIDEGTWEADIEAVAVAFKTFVEKVFAARRQAAPEFFKRQDWIEQIRAVRAKTYEVRKAAADLLSECPENLPAEMWQALKRRSKASEFEVGRDVGSMEKWMADTEALMAEVKKAIPIKIKT